MVVLKQRISKSHLALSLPAFAIAKRKWRLARLARFPNPPPLTCRFQYQRRNQFRLPGMLVDRDKRYVSRGCMLPLPGHRVLRIYFYAHFHRRMKHAIDLRLKIYNFPKIYGIPKINVVHGRCNYVTIRMPMRRQGPSHINQMHHLPAKQLPKRICLRRQNDFRHLRARSADWLPRTDEARQVLPGGTAAATKTGNDHASSEMEAVLNDIS